MTMWQVSPVALGPTILSTDFTVPIKGVLILYVFKGGSEASSSSRGTATLPSVAAPALATPAALKTSRDRRVFAAKLTGRHSPEKYTRASAPNAGHGFTWRQKTQLTFHTVRIHTYRCDKDEDPLRCGCNFASPSFKIHTEMCKAKNYVQTFFYTQSSTAFPVQGGFTRTSTTNTFTENGAWGNSWNKHRFFLLLRLKISITIRTSTVLRYIAYAITTVLYCTVKSQAKALKGMATS